MTLPQRVVVAVGTGFGLLTAAWTVNQLLWEPVGGWFEYAPSTGVIFDGPDPDLQALRSGAIFLAAVIVWTFHALWLFRPIPAEGAEPTP